MELNTGPSVSGGGGDGGKDGRKAIVSLKIFAPAIIFTIIMFGTLAWYAWYSYRHLMVVETQHFKATELVGRITHLDEVLTMSARMSAATGDPQWERRYGEYEPQLDAAIKDVNSLAPEALMSKGAAQTNAANVRLVEMEREAFGLVREGNGEAAMTLLHSVEYAEQKRIYSEGMNDFTEGLQRHTHTELRRHRRQILIAALFVAVSASLVLFVWVGMLQKLKYGSERRSSAKALRRSEAQFKDFFENTALGFYRTSPDGRILVANPALVRMLGYSSFEELAQRNLEKEGYEPQYSRSEFKERIEKEGRVVGLESAWVRRDGTALFIIENSRAIRDEDGNTLYYEGTAEDISERRKIGETLRRSEERFRFMIETTSDWVWQVDRNGIYTYCSPKVKDLLGYEPGEIVGKTPFDLMPSDEAERVGEIFQKTMVSQKSFERLENVNLHKDGRVVVLETSGVPIFDADGALAGYHGIDRDITKRKKAEDAVLAERNKLQSIAETIQCGLNIQDLEYNLTYQNDFMTRIFGEHMGGKCYSVIHGIDQVCEGCPVEMVFKDGKPHTSIRKVVLPSGEISYWENIANPIRDADGNIISCLKVVNNITDRKKEQEALAASEEKFRVITEQSFDVVMMTDMDKTFTYISLSALRVFGYRPDEMIGMKVSEVVCESDMPKVIQEFKDIAAGKTVEGHEVKIIRKDGSIGLIELNCGPVLRDGEVVGAQASARDITERKKAEEETKKFKTIAEKAGYGVGMIDLEGNLIYVNESFAEMHGYGVDELIGENLSILHTKEQMERVNSLNDQLLREGSFVGEEVWHKRRDKTAFPALMNGTLVRDEKGKALFMAATAIDITETKQAEAALRKSELQLKDIFENTVVGLYRTSPDGRILMANPALVRMLGYSSFEELSQRNLEQDGYEPQYLRSEFKERIEKEGQVVELESVWVRRDGTTLFIIENSRAIRDEDGNTLYYEGSAADITERKKAEEETKKFKTITERAGYGNAISDLEGNLLYVNESFAKMHGYRTDELKGKSLSTFHNDEQMERVNRLNERLEREGSFVGEEVWHRRKDDTTFPALMNGTLIRDENGRPLFMAATAIDIAEAKRAEAALRQSEQRYKTLVENLPQRVFLKDRNLIYVSCNENFARDIGVNPEDVPGKSDYDFAGELAEKYRADDKRVMESGEIQDIEERAVLRGQERTIHTVKTPVRDEDGKVVGVLGIFWDITEQKRLELALRESEEKYRTLVETAGETIITIDRDGVYLFMNKTAAERLGGKPEDYVGKTMWDAFPKEIADRQMAVVRGVIDTGKGSNHVMPTQLQGQMRWYNTTVEPLRDGSGEVVAALILARDIHEIRQAEMELEAYSEKMARAEQLASLGTLSATLSHELTQPLTVIGLSIEDALAELEGTSCPQAVGEGLRDSLSEVSNVTTIVERFRSFARKSSGKTVEKVELHIVAERIVKLLKKSAQQARIAVHLKGVDKLPAAYLNEKELEQLFFALVQNAIHAADGKKAHNLVVEGAVKSKYIELRFSDDCGGIEEADVDRVFEPFFTTKPAGEGTGLGLCIVQRAAERSGGRVRVENRPGEGVTFVVMLGISENTMS